MTAGGTNRVTDPVAGERWGRLIFVESAGSDKHNHARWLMRCDCGAQRIVMAHRLMRGTCSRGCSTRFNGCDKLDDMAARRARFKVPVSAVVDESGARRIVAEMRPGRYDIAGEPPRVVDSNECRPWAKAFRG